MTCFSRKNGVRRLSRLLGLLMIVLISSAAQATTYTWDGGGGDGDPALNSAVNWNPDSVPTFTNAADTYAFSGNVPTVPITVQSGAVYMRSMTFAASSGPFTFSPAGTATDADKIVTGGGTHSTGVYNNSTNTLTFNTQVAPSRGYISATSGNIVFNGLLNIANGAGAGTSGYYVQTTGPNNVYIQGAGGGLVGMGQPTYTSYNQQGNFVVGATSGALQGTVYIDTDSPISALNYGGGRWNGNLFIYNSNVRISTPYALGEGGATGGLTAIRSGDSLGRLELVNDITVGENLRLDGRNSATAVHVVNISGDNTLTGPLSTTTGTNIGLQSDAGLLTIQGNYTATATSATNRVLNLRGASNGRMEGQINASDGYITLSLNKYDGGVWTLTNALNNYTGTTTIVGGTLALEGSGAIASTPSIDVQSGAFLDVSAKTGGMTLGGTQTLKGAGTVLGSLATSYGSVIIPGSSAGTLTINGNLTLAGGDTLQYELSANPAGGNDQIDLNKLGGVGGDLTANTGVTTFNFSMLEGSLGIGAYTLISYEGSLLGNAGNFAYTGISAGDTRQTYAILTGNDVGGTAHQVDLIVTGEAKDLTWSGNNPGHDWDLKGDYNWNSGADQFYEGDRVTFNDDGSNTQAINLEVDVKPGTLTVNNPTKSYTFSGLGGIRGNTGITKEGAATLTIDNSGTNDFSGAIAVNGGTLEVGSGGYSGSLGPGAIALDAAGTLAFNRYDDVIVANTLSGSGTLEQKGTGKLELTGTATDFSGPVKVMTGTLKATNSLGTAASLPDVTDNALLQLGGSSSVTFTRKITGTGSLEKVDANTVYLASDDNNYSGSTTVTDGNLSVGTGGATGSLGGTGDITLGGTGSLRFYRWGTVDVSRNIVGTGLSTEAVRYGYGNNLNFQDAVYNVSGNNTYTGDTQVRGGTVVLSSDTGLGDVAGKTVIDNDDDVMACVALSGGITVAETFEIQPRGASLPISAGYTPHIQNLSGHNTLSGTIGTGTSGGGSIYTIRSDGTETGDLLTISGTILCERPSASCSLWLRGPGKAEVTGTIGVLSSCNWTNLAIADGGTWTFYGANSYYCGTSIEDGTLALGNLGGVDGTLGYSPLLTLESPTATLDLSGLSVPTLNMWSGMENIVGVGTINGNVSTGYISRISPSGPMTTTVLGSDKYTNLAGGTLNIQGNLDSDYGGETLIFKLNADTVNNDKIAVSNAVTLDGTSLTKVLVVPGGTLAGNYTLLTAASITVGINGGGFTVDPNHNTRYTMGLTLTPALNPTSLVLNVTGSNKILTWTGGNGTTWNSVAWDGSGYSGGYLNWQDVNPDDEMFYQGDAVVFGDGPTNTAIDLTGTLYPALVTVNASQNYTFQGAGRLSGGTSIVKSGSGTLTLANTGRNDYTGTVTITGGTLKPAGPYVLGTTAGGVIINGGTLDLSGYYNFRQEPISVQGAGADGSTGALVNNAADVSETPYLYYVALTGDATIGGTYDWSIQGNVLMYSGWDPGYLDGNANDLTKVGTNEITLADLGTTGLGDINITEGRLTVSGNTNLGASAINLSGEGWLTLDNATETVQKTLNVASTGGVVNNDAGNNTIAGSGGTLDGLLTVHAAPGTTLTLGNALDGTGGLTKVESGTLILSGANAYEGDTTISAGVVELITGGQIGVDSLIANAADLKVSSGDHIVGVITGSGTTTVLGSASLTATSITQGTLTIGGVSPAPVAAAPVPEPGVWAMLLAGLLGVALRRRFGRR